MLVRAPPLEVPSRSRRRLHSSEQRTLPVQRRTSQRTVAWITMRRRPLYGDQWRSRRWPLHPRFWRMALPPDAGSMKRNDPFQQRRACHGQEPGRKEERQEGADQDTEGKERSQAAQEGRKKALTGWQQSGSGVTPLPHGGLTFETQKVAAWVCLSSWPGCNCGHPPIPPAGESRCAQRSRAQHAVFSPSASRALAS